LQRYKKFLKPPNIFATFFKKIELNNPAFSLNNLTFSRNNPRLFADNLGLLISQSLCQRNASGKASVALYAKDGKIWLKQQQMAELFATSKQTISYHIINILKEKELSEISVVKEFLTTAADGKKYKGHKSS
jgi:hypothetical protein